MTALVITRPQGGAAQGGVPGTSVADIFINPGDTEQIDATDQLSAKWIYTLIDETNAKLLSGEVLGLNRMGLNPTHTTYAIIGDKIAHSVSVVMIGTDMSLQITNNSTVILKAHVVRINVVAQ